MILQTQIATVTDHYTYVWIAIDIDPNFSYAPCCIIVVVGGRTTIIIILWSRCVFSTIKFQVQRYISGPKQYKRPALMMIHLDPSVVRDVSLGYMNLNTWIVKCRIVVQHADYCRLRTNNPAEGRPFVTDLPMWWMIRWYVWETRNRLTRFYLYV